MSKQGVFEWQVAMAVANMPGLPAPRCTVRDAHDGLRRFTLQWGDAYLTLTYFPCEGCAIPHIIHVEEICSAVGRAHPTGFMTEIIERLIPLAEEMGVYVLSCEPATEFAKDRLASRGNWAEAPDGVWVWMLKDPHELNLPLVAEDTKILTDRVKADR